MLKFIGWVRRYWYIPLVLFVGVLGFVLGRRRESPVERTRAELKAIDAATETKKLEALVGAEKARQAVEYEYRHTMRELDEKQKEKAKELRNDPAKLAKFLVRAGRAVSER